MIPPKAPPVGPQGPVATVLAGRGQKLHEIEIKDAELFHGRGKMDELTKLVKKQLKLK
jgi:hypothetical protein